MSAWTCNLNTVFPAMDVSEYPQRRSVAVSVLFLFLLVVQYPPAAEIEYRLRRDPP